MGPNLGGGCKLHPHFLNFGPGGIAPSSDHIRALTTNAEALADTLETQFQPVGNPSVPAVIEMVDVALRSYIQTPTSEPRLTNPDENHEAIGDLKAARLLAQTIK